MGVGCKCPITHSLATSLMHVELCFSTYFRWLDIYYKILDFGQIVLFVQLAIGQVVLFVEFTLGQEVMIRQRFAKKGIRQKWIRRDVFTRVF